MSEKLEQLKQRLEEIAKLDLAEQPEAYSKLHDELNEELNATDSAE